VFEAGSIIVDLAISLVDLLIEIVRLCLKFVLRCLGYSDTRSAKVINNLGWISLAILIGFLVFLVIRFN